MITNLKITNVKITCEFDYTPEDGEVVPPIAMPPREPAIPPEEPAIPPEETPKTILVLVVGGLGNSQLDDGDSQAQNMLLALQANCSAKAEIHDAGSWNGYKVDVSAMVAEHPGMKIVLIGHSFGGATVIKACSDIAQVDYVVAIDAVNDDPCWGDLVMPTNMIKYDFYVRSSGWGPRTARIPGAMMQTLEGGHNSVAHDQEMIQKTINMINSL